MDTAPYVSACASPHAYPSGGEETANTMRCCTPAGAVRAQDGNAAAPTSPGPGPAVLTAGGSESHNAQDPLPLSDSETLAPPFNRSMSECSQAVTARSAVQCDASSSVAASTLVPVAAACSSVAPPGSGGAAAAVAAAVTVCASSAAPPAPVRCADNHVVAVAAAGCGQREVVHVPDEPSAQDVSFRGEAANYHAAMAHFLKAVSALLTVVETNGSSGTQQAVAQGKHLVAAISPAAWQRVFREVLSAMDRPVVDAFASIPYNREHQAVREFAASLNMPTAMFAPDRNRCFCTECEPHGCVGAVAYAGVPAAPATVPYGWTRVGLAVDARAQSMDVLNEWHVAYHGTSAHNVRSILWSGGLCLPGSTVHCGGRVRVQDGHIRTSMVRVVEDHGVLKSYDFDAQQVFATPSLLYASHGDVYARKVPFVTTTGVYYDVQVVLELRLRPGAYGVGPQTVNKVLHGVQYDPQFSNEVLEWATTETSAVVLTGLLFKCTRPSGRAPAKLAPVKPARSVATGVGAPPAGAMGTTAAAAATAVTTATITAVAAVDARGLPRRATVVTSAVKGGEAPARLPLTPAQPPLSGTAGVCTALHSSCAAQLRASMPALKRTDDTLETTLPKRRRHK